MWRCGDHLPTSVPCYLYNVFLMILIDIFVLNSYPMSASLRSLGIFVKQIKGQFQGQISFFNK